MTHEETLTKAIEKAIANGWDKFGNPKHNYRLKAFTDTQGKPDIEFKLVRGSNDVCYYTINDIIYNHDFAKALWGDGTLPNFSQYSGMATTKSGEFDIAEPWKTHLQQMVIADDPIAYLAENI